MKHLRNICLITAIIIIMACFGTGAFAVSQNESAYPTDKVVTLYSEENYEGQSKAFGVGDYPDVAFTSKSIDVPAEYSVTAYSGKNFTGKEYKIEYGKEKYFSIGMGEGNYKFILGINNIKAIKSMKVSLVESEGFEADINLTDAQKNEILIKYAPRIYMAKDDPYEAASLEYVFANMTATDYTMELNDPITLKNPLEIKDYFYGDNSTAVAYAFWVEKEGGYADLSYFQYCPYDSGKYIWFLGTNLGRHVGDWEHVTIRLMRYELDGKTYMRPVKVAFNIHSGGITYHNWEDVEFAGKNHIQVYACEGSHGIYNCEGTHNYVDFGFVKLNDPCSKGTALDLWDESRMETFEFMAPIDNEQGERINTVEARALAGSEWAYIFNWTKDGEHEDAIHRWGTSPSVGDISLAGLYGSSPSGPQHKDELTSRYSFS